MPYELMLFVTRYTQMKATRSFFGVHKTLPFPLPGQTGVTFRGRFVKRRFSAPSRLPGRKIFVADLVNENDRVSSLRTHNMKQIPFIIYIIIYNINTILVQYLSYECVSRKLRVTEKHVYFLMFSFCLIA